MYKKLYKDKQVGAHAMETINTPKIKFKEMQIELETLRKSRLYQRLLEFEQRILQGKRYIRADLGF